MDKDKLIKFITGNLDESEAPEVRAWIRADESNKSDFIRLKNIYALSAQGKHTLKIDEDYLNLNRQITAKPQPTELKPFIRILKYAAIFVAAVLIGYSAFEIRSVLLYFSHDVLSNEFYAPEGQISEFKLSDGTRVWLNSGTRIQVPENYSRFNRRIFLEGEAYFEVTKDRFHPLYLKTKDLDIKVLGTSFNVSAYQSDENLEVTLVEGAVGIKNATGQRLMRLLPGQQMVFNKMTGAKFKNEVDTSPYRTWRNGIMTFRNRSLEYIANRLRRWYNVEIDFANASIAQLKFTGTILKNKPLSQVLDIITLSAPIKYDIKINDNKKNVVTLYSLKNSKIMN